VAWIEAAQAQGVIANVKHYAANNQEGLAGVPPVISVAGGRQLSNDVIDERTLREVYLPQFEAAVKEAHSGSVMCSYNQVRGQFACENQHLLTDVLKQWGFGGYVLSDYAATHNTANSIHYGLDFEPWPAVNYGPNAVKAAVASGQVTQAEVDAHVFRIMRTMFQFGIFDRPVQAPNDNLIPKAADAAKSLGIEESAITLLKNSGQALPINPGAVKRVAVIGPYANRFVTGGGSGQVTPFATVTALDGIKARLGPSVNVTYDDGSDVNKAVADAAAADQAIVVVGDVDTEGQDKGSVTTNPVGVACISLNCPDDAINALAFACSSACPPNGTNEDGLVSSVAAAQRKTTVVLETSGPVLTPWRGQVPAILEAWYPGAHGGAAIAGVLFGDVNPSGRLPVTFPQNAGDTPTANDINKYPGAGETVTYSEGVFIGYRWYDAHNITPAFPFGFGLSYTTFSYSNLHIQPGGPGGAVGTVTLDVTNTGSRAGSVVPQLYLALPSPSATVLQPPKQLRGYRKVSLASGQKATVSFPLDERAFSYWDVVSSSWKVAPGCYGVLGGDSTRQLPLTGTIARAASCGAGAVSIPLNTSAASNGPAGTPGTSTAPPILWALAIGLLLLAAVAGGLKGLRRA
jgi:beta-glucosidase